MNKIVFTFIYCAAIIALLQSCKGAKAGGQRKINLTDTTGLVIEQDSAYLQNVVADITPSKQTKKDIAQKIEKVDSAKEAVAIAATENNSVEGTLVKQTDFNATFSAKLAQQGTKYTIADLKALDATKVQVNGLKNLKAEQRFITTLYANIDGVAYELEDLQEFGTPWQILTLKDNIATTLYSNTATFRDVNNNSIKNAVDRALRKSGIKGKKLNEIQASLSKTNSYKDAPLQIVLVGVEVKITGNNNNKKVSKTITIVKQ